MKKYTIVFLLLLQLASAQTCLKCKPTACTAQGCTQCQDGYMLSSQGWCGIFTPVEGCRTYDAANNVCVGCNPDRELIEQRCYNRPENCQVSDKFRECLRCKPNFQLQRGKCLTKDIANCPLGSLPVTGFCQPLRAQNCKTMDDQRTCTACDPSYTLLNGRCLKIRNSYVCPSNQCSCPDGITFSQTCYQVLIDKCTLYRDPIYCNGCERGSVAIDGICLQPVKYDDVNCNVIAPNSDYCTACNQDYFLNRDAFCYRNYDFNSVTCPIGNKFIWENEKCLYWDRRCDAVDFSNTNYLCIRCQESHQINPVNGRCERNICTRFVNGICTETFLGYYINTTKGVNQYEILPKNCLAVDASQVCTQCSSFTKFLPMTQTPGSQFVCAYEDVNCQQYNMNGSCIKCLNSSAPDGYILRERFCFKKAQNCLTRQSPDQSKCLICNPGYHLEQTDRKCYINMPGCEVYLFGSDCKQCVAQTYQLYQKKCYEINPECLDYENGLCKRCTQGFLPFRNTCVYYHPYCLEYTNRVCSRVATGWSLGTGMTEAQKSYYRAFISQGELVKNRNTAVNTAQLPAVSSSDAGTYVPGALITRFPYANVVHAKISSVNVLGQVTACNPGYTLVNLACIQKVVANCQLYSADEICTRCGAGFTLTANFTCIQGLQCDTQDVSNGRCTKCRAGYILVGVQCFELGSNDVINQQVAQTNIFYRHNWSNGSYMAWPRIQNCRTQANPVACSQCLPPYQSVNGLCIIPVDRCLDYGFSRGQTPGICLFCENGFTLWLGQCRRLICNANGGVCQTCIANYFYYFGLCLINPQGNCRMYENNICVSCDFGFYVNSQNQCQPEVSGCLTTNRDTGRCLQCRAGMVLYLQRCVNEILYCVDYNSNNQCIRCQQNTVNRTQLMSDSTCGLLVGQCAKLNDVTRQCSECNLGYSPITQNNTILCVTRRNNCQTYDIRGRCITCNPLYVLRNNQCIRYIQFCLNYTSDQSSCTFCAPGSQLDNGCCRVPDPNCINYNQCSCTKCMTRYYLNDNGKCIQNIQGCDIYNKTTNKCDKCASQFYILVDGTCMSQEFVTNGCQQGYNLTYNLNYGYQCVKCIQGFQLNVTDNLCYAYNCMGVMQTTRHCLSCPLYYKVYKGSSFNEYQNYCIPYFCETYLPNQDQCLTNSSTYYGGHLIIITTRTITIQYCLTTEQTTGKCTSCSNFRYPNTNTLYNLCYPSHCVSITQFNCLRCQFGYGLDGRFPGSCLALFCAMYKNDGSCSSCVAPYTLTNSGICENKGCCEIYDPVKNICQTAKKYFFIQNNICIPVNCAKYDPKLLTSCVECEKGYTLFPDGTCRVANCQQDTFSGQSCVVCNRGFKLEYSTTSTKTICLPRYCLDYAKDFNTCLKCAQGFTLDSDKLCRADYCANYQSNLICQTCIPYFKLTQNERCVADCSVGNTTSCKCCNYGFSLNTTSLLCQTTQQFCQKVNPSSGLCSQCQPGYNLISGRCIAPVANCQTPSMFGCLSCKAGFELLDNCRCVPKYCNQVGPDGKCAVCHPRFELTAEGLCRTRDCQFFSVENWACNGCYGRFKFVDNICVTIECQAWQDYQNTTCRICNTATSTSSTDFSKTLSIQYNLTFGACYIKFCKNDPRDFYCKQCILGYKLTTTGLCECANYDSTRNICICPDGYVYNQNTGICQINRDVCLQRNGNGTCLQCPFQYQDPGVSGLGECVPMFCEKWELVATAYIQCRKCYVNFGLVNGFCQSTLCLKYQNKTGLLFPQCTSCQTGWNPFSNICVPSHCQPSSYNLQTLVCQTCTGFGYILSQDKQKCVVANCQIDLPPDQCAKCKLGYYNFTGLCIASNCTVFQEVTCKACVDGFELKGELCYAVGCLEFGEGNFCMRCKEGYVVLQNYTCGREFCLIDSKDKCLKCIKSYTYNPTLQKCVPTNCQKYSQNYQTCQTCLPGYYKQNNTCLDIRCNITQFTQQYKCMKCQTGYQFNKDGLCYPTGTDFCPIGKYYNVTVGACVNIPVSDCRVFVNKMCMWCADNFFLYNNLCYSTRFCSKWSYFYGCYECFRGYYLEDRQCKQYKQDPNCQEVVSNACTRCKQGYQLWSGRCVLIPQNCLEVDVDGRCTRCVPGFGIVNGVCQGSDPNCLNYNSQGKCNLCIDGFYPNTQGLCQQNPVNCTKADTNGKCLQCVSGYYLQNGRCFKQYPFCQKYSETTEFCIGCISNFTLLGLQCQCASDSQLILNKFCIKLPSNCLQISPNTFLCIRCAKNYNLTADFRCVLSNITPPENCNVYDPLTGICKECFSGFVVVNGLCRACPAGQVQVGNLCFAIIVGCKDYTATGACRTCADGYRLDNNKCVKIQVPLFCQIYDPATGFCQKCILGYTLTPTQTCMLTNCLIPSQDGKSCQKCIQTYNWTGKECRFETEFCLTYFNGKCQTCENFAALSQSRCVPNFCNAYDYTVGVCNGCLAGYVLAFRRCFGVITGCSDYLVTGLCRVCATGYNLVNGLCQKVDIQIPQFCTNFVQGTGCTACIAGYTPTPDNKLCILTNCQTMSPTNTTCLSCISPFQWSPQSQCCIFQTDFCSLYSNQTGYCTSCLSFASLQRNRCVPSFCSSYNFNTGVCETCNTGYILGLNVRRCFVVIVYCVGYGDTGLCTQCQGGYVITNGGAACVADAIPAVPSCYAQTGRNCSRCRHRYYLDSQTCSAYIPYCINLDPTGKCISCCFGSTLINGICQRDTTIRYCANQVGNVCQQCVANYYYCQFCEACLPASPNCNRYNVGGDCVECSENFVLVNGVCVGLPVGFVAGAVGTCRTGYVSRDGNCYRDPTDLKTYQTTATQSTLTLLSPTQTDPLVLFSIILKTTSSILPTNSSFLLYYRSKINDPLICWNSCIPTRISSRNEVRELVYPIVAYEVVVYVFGIGVGNVGVEFRGL